MVAATGEYARDSDQLAGFRGGACDLETGAKVDAAELFESYQQWAKQQGPDDRERPTATGFGRNVTERFEHERTRAGKSYKGVKTRTA